MSSMSRESNDDDAPLVIVGAGQAGAMAARALRESGYAGKLVLIGDEPHAPYERPPLSKAVLAEATVPDVGLLAPTFYAEHGVMLKSDCRVVHLDATQHALRLEDGTVQRYRSCLLATGGAARTLADLPPGSANVHYLRTLGDALRLRDAMRDTENLLVVGGGFLGLEVASTARTLGVAVTIVEQGPVLLGRSMPPILSEWIAQRARAYGVQLYLGAALSGFAHVDSGIEAALTDGPILRARQAVVAVGLVPNVELARNAGIDIDAKNGGILVDAHCRTSAADVYAAGDCASGYHTRTGSHMRLESWQNANEQARLAAAAMLGIDAAPAPHAWFWTDQFGCNVQMMGHGSASLNYRLRGTLPSGCQSAKALLFGLNGDRLMHIVAINAGGDLRAFRDLLGHPLGYPIEKLCDTTMTARQIARLATDKVVS